MKPHVGFEWDEAKRRANLWRHGIDFAEVVAVFSGFTLTIEDDRYDYGERRLSTYGLYKGRVVAIAHTERQNGKITRLISARWASKHEEIDYFKEIWN